MAKSSVEAEVAFDSARGYAIAQYAYYEEALCLLYAHLLGIEPAVAGITFFRLNNARARVDIIEKLLKRKHLDAYKDFWDSMRKHLSLLDQARNQVVHWTTMVTHFEEPVVTLNPPNYWDEGKNTPSLKIGDLIEFAQKCQFFCNTLAYFTYHLEGQPFVQPAWREIFLRPIQYPHPGIPPHSRAHKAP